MPSLSSFAAALVLLLPTLAHALYEPRKVDFDVHLMSMCPDARDCMELLVSPAMQQVASKVKFRIDFIGR